MDKDLAEIINILQNERQNYKDQIAQCTDAHSKVFMLGRADGIGQALALLTTLRAGR